MSIFGDVLGSIVSSKANKKAAKIQAQTTDKILAANNENRTFITGLNQPNIDRGNVAGTTYAGLLGFGDAAASSAALDTWRGSTGYQDLLNTGLGAVNSGAYARGLGDSGATLKALQTRGMNIANQNQQQYMGNLGTLIATGNSAIGNVSGAAMDTTKANNGALQTNADAQGHNALMQGSIWSNLIKKTDNNINSFASSYTGGFGG